MYRCRYCLRPIERTIEGECVCVSCATREDILPDQEAIQWLKSHCAGCDKPLTGGGYCSECQKEQDQTLATLLQEHQGSTAFVHWRGPGWYVPVVSQYDGDLFYYHADHKPWGNDNVTGWPTINVQVYGDLYTTLDEHGTFVACMTGMEREDYVPKRNL